MKAALAAVLLAAGPGVARAASPSMSDDYKSMMAWLTNETVQGLAFNSGSTFDPPSELKPWRMQPDLSLGIGFVPLNKKKFPTINTRALDEQDPAGMLPGKVMFPNMTLHLRMGLPRRWDVSVRGANMTVPQGYRLSGSTRGDGQSNSIGFGLRRHFFGGDRPLVSVAGNFNHVFGRFNFSSEFKRMELFDGFFVDSSNHGQLEWNVNSMGINGIVSRSFGIMTPFLGAGYSHMTGSVRARLQSDFATPLIMPSVGEASDKPEEHQARVLCGAQMDRSRLSFFLNGELKAIGASAGKTFIVSAGLVAPFRIGALSVVDRREAARERRLARERPASSGAGLLSAPRERLAERVVPLDVRIEGRSKGKSREELPELIFIR